MQQGNISFQNISPQTVRLALFSWGREKRQKIMRLTTESRELARLYKYEGT